uniref:Uncharacterized protein n=1 Tax=Anguilla anguilla TaxID=7936 RepID=A0A0E9VP34_ANGAN
MRPGRKCNLYSCGRFDVGEKKGVALRSVKIL